MFSCVWLHFKKCFGKYFLMFGCVLENTIENTFSTCCSHFLTFSWLPNEYIISFISQNTNKTQKKIIKSEQMKARLRSRSRSRSGRLRLRSTPIGAVTIAPIGAVPVITRWCLGCSLITSIGAVPVITPIILSLSR